MKGKLYAIGVGPGDPELLTLKAARLIKEAKTVAVPRGREDGGSLALRITQRAVCLEGKRVLELHFPMVKELSPGALRPAAEEVLSALKEGDTAFLTLGDPTLYSTFFHLYRELLNLEPSARAEIVPGVSSITASAARAGRMLALSGEKVAILPAAYIEDYGRLLKEFDCVVLMKAHRVMDRIKAALREAGLLEEAVYVSRAGLEGETIKPAAEVTGEDLDYFSTVIVRAKK